MPLLAALLGNAFSGVVAFLAAMVGKKIAVGAALAAFLVGGWVALQLGLKALVASIGLAIPEAIVPALQLAAYCLPTNLAACLQALVLARAGRWLWDRQREWAGAVAAA